MRLLEFLQDTPQQEAPIRSVQIPLWYLGGSYHAYQQYRSTGLLESLLPLFEGAADRYRQMIQVFDKWDKSFGPDAGLGDGLFAEANKHLEWAMQTLKREDRIVWYMRLIKVSMLANIMHKPFRDGPNMHEYQNIVNKEYQKSINKAAKVYHSPQHATQVANQLMQSAWKQSIEHFLSMNMPKVTKVQWSDQEPNELTRLFGELEQEWIARQESIIDISKDADRDSYEIIEQFDNGSVWVNLNRMSCRYEADAMGHCGNAGTPNNGDRVLSYRVPVDENGNYHNPNKSDGVHVHWRPSLTFILDRDGNLGEMKGRANGKPSDKYHSQIIRLLMNPIVKGIKGGGYMPESNFELNDLGEDTKKQILAKRPELGSLMDMIEMAGGKVTEQVVNRIQRDFDDAEQDFIVELENIHFGQYESLYDFVEHHERELGTAKAAMDQLSGDGESWDFHDSYYSGSNDEKEELIDDTGRKHPAWLAELKAYVLHEYGDEFDEDRDIDDTGDIVAVLDENDDDVHMQLGWAIVDGHRYGAEAEMYEAFKRWIENIFNDRRTNMRLVPSNPNAHYDDTAWELVYPTIDYVKMLVRDNDLEAGEFYYNSPIDLLADGGLDDLQEPHYGWSGYDADAAIESAYERVEIPEIPELEVPEKGNGTQEKLKAFNSDMKEKVLTSETVASFSDAYKTAVHGLGLVNGAIVANVYTWPQEFKDDELEGKRAFVGMLKDMAVIADQHDVPLVIRRWNDQFMSDMVTALGYVKQDNGYYRFDPKGKS